MIDVEHLTFEYPTVRALRDVSFHVPPGTITALVGPNGAGKTTLLRCIAALDTPFSGSVRVNGLDTREAPRAVHRNLGYLSDFFGLYDDLTVERCLTYMARIHGAPESQVERTARRVGLGGYLHVTPRELSRGLRQRLAIGQAILHEPPVVLLDEPASGLDPGARIALGRLFVELGESGMTLVVSSHILAELEAYATDLLILEDGAVVDHRSVAARGPGRERLRVELSAPDPRLGAVLAAGPGVDRLEVDGTQARFDFAGDADARHRLLASLLAEGLPVCGLAPVKEGLQEAYLSQVSPGVRD